MEFSNILDKVSHKDALPKRFLALELTDDIVQAAIWHVSDSVTEVVAIGAPVPWNGDEGNLEELISSVDTTITSSTKEMDEAPSEVIFGIPNTWIEGAKVLDIKKTYLKKISQDLELKPLGYVIVMDSLIRYLRIIEGTPATAILIQVADTELTVATVVQGVTHAIKTIPRSDDVTTDVESGIAATTKGASSLPSRFLVFDGMHDLEEVVQNLTLVEWTSKFPFLHIPKIEALSKDIVIKALCVAGGAEVARSIGFTIKDEETPPKPADSESPLAELGFAAVEETSESAETVEEEIIEEEVAPPKSKSKLPRINLPHPSFHMPKLNLPKFRPPLWGLAAATALSLGFFLLAGSLWLFPKATVTLTLAPKHESTQFSLKLDPSATAVDEATFSIPVTKVDTSVTGEGSIATTGTVEVGEKAKGEVTIYNRTLANKTFTKGTVITANKLNFTLDEEVSVASKSVGADYVDVPGKAQVSITASSIGDKANLASGTEFTIGNFTTESYIAKHDSSLKGGSSRSVAAVSAKDRINLLKELTVKLESEARQNLENSGSLVHILPDSTEVVDESFSTKLKEEADTLSATITVKVYGYELSPSDLMTLAQIKVTQKLEGYDQISEPEIELVGGDDSQVTVTASVQSLPKLDQASLQDSLRGIRGEEVLNQALQTVPGLVQARTAISPSWIPKFLKSLPRKAENIEIVVVPASGG